MNSEDNKIFEFFLDGYKIYCLNNNIKYNQSNAIKEFTQFCQHVNKLGDEYFNSSYFQGVQNDKKGHI